MKNFDPATITRKNILQLKPYASARSEFNTVASVYLDANENALASVYNRYPDPLQQELKQEISVLKNVPAPQVFIGNGSDEPIDLLLRIFCRPGQDNIIICPPTYGMYEVAANINEVRIQEVPLTTDFRLDTKAILDAVNADTKAIFICTPNNPTGNSMDSKAISNICNSFNGIVIIDEAYIDFSEAVSWTEQLSAFPNMVVLQTFSKAWGIAALRIGMAFASAEIIALMNKVKAPYNINAVSQQLAMAAIVQKDKVATWIATIKAQRMIMQERLASFSCVQKIYPSDANFLLVQVTDAAAVYHHLLKYGIVVRRRDSVHGCAQCLRITIGTHIENEQLYKALESFTA